MLDTPDAALNRAATWAVHQVGGHLRVDPAGVRAAAFEADDERELLEDARRWARVRAPGLLDPAEFLGRVVGGLFGASMDGAGGRLELRPRLPEGWRRMGLRRLRAHRTVLDLEVRPRAEWVTVRLAVTFGPPIATLVSLPDDGPGVARVTVDEVPLDASRAIFTLQGEHEVMLFQGLRPERSPSGAD